MIKSFERFKDGDEEPSCKEDWSSHGEMIASVRRSWCTRALLSDEVRPVEEAMSVAKKRLDARKARVRRELTIGALCI